jgi:hypothetical protein
MSDEFNQLFRATSDRERLLNPATDYSYIFSLSETLPASQVYPPHDMSDSIPFMQFVCERLKQCNVKYIYGVPGDYNLEALGKLVSTRQS